MEYVWRKNSKVGLRENEGRAMRYAARRDQGTEGAHGEGHEGNM